MLNRLRFGRFELLPTERKLLDDGRPVVLGARAFDLLLALVERRDRLVGKNELLDLVWPGLIVEEGNLPVQVSGLRKLIGPQAIATVPGRGYRFTMGVEGDATASLLAQAALPRAPTARTNVPAALDTLIGREAEVAELRRWLNAHRLVTVLGPGGIGKTRLAQVVARDLAGGFADGTWWVDLAAHSSAERVVPAIASAARLDLGDGDPLVMLARALSPRDTLLVLDNCEHLVTDVAKILHEALGSAPRLRVLATSQASLKASGEQLYRLDGLAVPPSGTPLSAAREYGALQLLECRAQSSDRHFALNDQSVAAAIDLCRHLDGIALAIEMAAARLPVHGVREVLQRLGERFRLLRNPGRTAPPRQLTLRATLDWSHSLLTDTEQAVLRRLSVFVGSFRLDGAQQVAAAATVDEWAALDALDTLADKSLLQVECLDPPRYRLLETVRIYASEQLVKHAELVDAQLRHDQSMAHIAAQAEQAFWVLADTPWWACYAPDMDDVEESFWRACQRRDAYVATTTGQLLARRDYLGTAAELSAMHRRAQAAHALLPVAPPRERAIIWNWMASCWPHQACGVPRARAAAEAVSAWRALDDPRQLYAALARLAFEAANADDLETASIALEEAHGMEDAAWTPRLRLTLASLAAGVDERRGDIAQHREQLRRELALAEQAGAEVSAAFARFRLADIASAAGDFEEAVTLGRAVVAEQRRLVRQSVLHIALGNLCGALLMLGDIEAAAEAALEALPLALEEWVGFLLDHVALLAARIGRCSEAARMLGSADAWYAAIGLDRFPNEARSARLAIEAIDDELKPAARSLLFSAGGSLSSAKIDALVRSVLSATSPTGSPVPSPPAAPPAPSLPGRGCATTRPRPS